MSTKQASKEREKLARKLSDTGALTAAMQQSVRAAVLDHKRAGNPVAAWKDGQVVWVQPEDIELPDEDAVAQTSAERSAA